MAKKSTGSKTISTKSQQGSTLQGVSRALRVLEVLAERPMKASEVAEALDLPWATCHRTLVQLASDQFVEKDGVSGEYRIGRHTWLLGSTYLVGHRVLDLAAPILKSASAALPAAVFQLVERRDGVSLVLYSVEAASGEYITRAAYGYHFPLHCGSKGWILLAYAPSDFIDDYLEGPLVALTPDTITNPGEMRERLGEVRSQGYAVTLSDVQSFTGSVAAPVFDGRGENVAAVCAVMERGYLSDERKQARAVEHITRLGQSISLALGWQPVRAADRLQPTNHAKRGPGRPPSGRSSAE